MKRLAFLAVAFAVVGCNGGSDTGTTTTTTTGTTPPTTTTTSGDGGKPTTPESTTFVGESSTLADAKPVDGEEVGVIDTKMGQIVVRFYRDKAPKHVANFKKLASESFYDGTTFHRIKPDFMIQGGDPNSKDNDPSNDGAGGPGTTVDAEFSEISHVRGILSMARAQDPNSAGSQFFIVCKDSLFLDTQYSVFGRVVHDGTEKPGDEPNGLKVVDKIAGGARKGPQDDLAVTPVAMKVTIKRWPIK